MFSRSFKEYVTLFILRNSETYKKSMFVLSKICYKYSRTRFDRDWGDSEILPVPVRNGVLCRKARKQLSFARQGIQYQYGEDLVRSIGGAAMEAIGLSVCRVFKI